MKTIDTLKAEIEKDLREQDNGLAQGTLTPIPLEQIKPVVIGCQRVYSDGEIGYFTLDMNRLSELVSLSHSRSHKRTAVHANGKPRFRLVYDYGVKP